MYTKSTRVSAPSSELGPPFFPPQSCVFSPLGPKGGRSNPPFWVTGCVGGTQFGGQERKPGTLYTLCYLPTTTPSKSNPSLPIVSIILFHLRYIFLHSGRWCSPPPGGPLGGGGGYESPPSPPAIHYIYIRGE
jgi:hypothetical protein